MRRALSISGYRRLLTAYTLNELAWGIGTVALALLVYRRTGTAIGAAAFFLCSSFVPALFSPALVSRLDQYDVRRVLPTLYLLEMVAFLVLAWLVGRFSLAPILLLSLADGTVGLAARALARTASVSVLTPAKLLREGNAIANASFAVCYMAGPALGGVLVAADGTRSALLVNSGLFVTMALTLATTTDLPAAPNERVPVAGRLRAALRHAAGDLMVRRLLSLQSIALVFFTISIPVEVVYAQHTLHAGAGGYGALLSAWGAGAIAGSLIYAKARRRPSWVLITVGAAGVGAGLAVMAVAPSLGVGLAGAALGGAGNGIEIVSVRTALQELVGESWMARIMSLNESITQALPGAGIVIGGALAAIAGARTALAVAGVGSLVVTAVCSLVLRTLPDAPTEPKAGDGQPAEPAREERRQREDSLPSTGPIAVGAGDARGDSPSVVWGFALSRLGLASTRRRRRGQRR